MNYRQRSNETPAIKPFGFTGIISKNSNITVDKSYIEKGTSFVNAFDNSNVLLKDCGSPIPESGATQEFVSELMKQVKSENDSIKLPPWIHYKLKRFDTSDQETVALSGENKFIVNLEHVRNTSDQILSYRNAVLDKAKPDEYNDLVANSDLIPEICMYKDGIDTGTVSHTANGTYVLSAVESSIRAVWPMDSNTVNDIEISPEQPPLNLHFVNREIFNMLNSNGKEVLISDIYKTDKFGKYKELEDRTTVNVSDKTHKYIVKVTANRIQYKRDSADEFVPIIISRNNTDLSTVYINCETVNGKKYIMGPYFNNKKYICYYKPSKSGQELINDEPGDEMNLYFKFGKDENNKELVFNLFSAINGEYEDVNGISGIPSSVLYALNQYFEVSNLVENPSLESSRIKLRVFSERTNEFQPDGNYENCKLVGLKMSEGNYQPGELDNENIINILSGTRYIDCENDLLGFDKDEIADLPVYKINTNNNLTDIHLRKNLSAYFISINPNEDWEVTAAKTLFENNELEVSYKSHISAFVKADEHIKIIKSSIDDVKALVFDQLSGLVSSVNLKTFETKFDRLSANFKADCLFNKYSIENNFNPGDAEHHNWLAVTKTGQTGNAAVLKPKFGATSGYYLFKVSLVNESTNATLNNLTYSFNNSQISETEATLAKSLTGSDKLNPFTYNTATDNVETALNSAYNSADKSGYKDTVSDSFDFEGLEYNMNGRYLPAEYTNDRYTIKNKQSLLTGYYLVKVKINSTNKQLSADLNSKIFKLGISDDIDEFTDNVGQSKYLSAYFDIDTADDTIKSKTVSVLEYSKTDEIAKMLFYKHNGTNWVYTAENNNFKVVDSSASTATVSGLMIIAANVLANSLSSYYQLNNVIDYSEFNLTGNFNNEKNIPAKTFEVNLNNINAVIADSSLSSIISIGSGAVIDTANTETIASNIDVLTVTEDKDLDSIDSLTPYINGFKTSVIENLTGCLTGAIETPIDISNMGNIHYLDNDVFEYEATDIRLSNSLTSDATSLRDFFNKLMDSYDSVKVVVNYARSDGEPDEEIKYYDGYRITSAPNKISNLVLSTTVTKLPTNRTYNANVLNNLAVVKLTGSGNQISAEVVTDPESFTEDSFEQFVKNNEHYKAFITANAADYTSEISADLERLVDGGDLSSFIVTGRNTDDMPTNAVIDLSNKIKVDAEQLGYNYQNNPEQFKYLYYNKAKVYESLVENKNIIIIRNEANTEYNLKFNFNANSDGIIDSVSGDIIRLYFDKNCNIPFEIDSDNYQMYDHDSQGKKIYADKNKIWSEAEDGIVTKFNYKYAYEFEYEKKVEYQKENFNDWYDVDTYVNYSYLNTTATNGKYKLTLNILPKYVNNYAVLTGNTTVSLESNVSSGSYIVVNPGLKYNVEPDDYNFNSLLHQEDSSSKYLGYKSFSFNFMIPSEGWNKFNEKMYKNNDDNEILANITDDLFPVTLKSISGTTYFEFEGMFYARYRNLKSGTQTNANATGMDRYVLTSLYDAPFVASVKKTNDGNDDHLLFSISSKKNPSLRFSTYLNRADDLTDQNDITIGKFSNIHTLNGLTFDYQREGVTQSSKIQLSNIDLFIEFSRTDATSGNTKLYISTTYSNDVSSGLLLNSVNLATSSFVQAMRTDLTGDDSIRMAELIDLMENEDTAKIYEYSKELSGIANAPTAHISSYTILSTTVSSSFGFSSFPVSGNLSEEDFYRKSNNMGYYNNGKFFKVPLDSFAELNTTMENFKNIAKVPSYQTTCSHLEKLHIRGPICTQYTHFDFIQGKIYYTTKSQRKLNINGKITEMRGSGSTITTTNYVKAYELENTTVKDLYLDLTVYGMVWFNFNLNASDYYCIPVTFNSILERAFIHNTKNWTPTTGLVRAPKYCIINGKVFEYSGMKSVHGKDSKCFNGTSVVDLTGDWYQNSWSGTQLTGNYQSAKLGISQDRQTQKHINGYSSLRTVENKKQMEFLVPVADPNKSYELDTTNIAVPIFTFTYKLTTLSVESVANIIKKTVPITKYEVVSYTYPDSISTIDPAEIYGNLINDVKSSDDYFVTWMAPADLRFAPSGMAPAADDVRLSAVTDFGISHSNDGNLSSSLAMVNEQFKKPFDMSTNLFYYKNDTTDEKLIINAKKMYNQIDKSNKKPDDGSLNIDFNDLYDKEIILTGDVDFKTASDGEKLVKLQRFYRNANFEYQMQDDGENIPNSYNEIRYTDMDERSSQWYVYKLSKDISFTSVNDISVKCIPENNQSSNENENDYDRLNSFDIPCKIRISFNDLLLKQKCREGIGFDNVKHIDFDQKLFSPDMFNSSVTGLLSARWGLEAIPSSMKPIVDGIVKETDSDFAQYGFLADYADRMKNTECYLGGSQYFNDVVAMNTVNNSVNKWETDKASSKYDKLYVFSDYSPVYAPTTGETATLIGTPYLNLDKTMSFQITDPNDISVSYVQKAEIAKIAKDEKYINNINASEDAPLEEYPSPNDLITNPYCTYSLGSSNFEYIDVTLSAIIHDTDLKGMVWFKPDEGNVGSSCIISNSKEDAQFGIYFDGLLYGKEVYTNRNCSLAGKNLISVETNTVELSNDGRLNGSIRFQVVPENSDPASQLIELHNVKPKSPTINKFGIFYDDSSELEDGMLKVDNNEWAKYVYLNQKFEKYYTGNDQPFFSLQTSEDIRSNITEKKDANGKTIGLHITIKIKGLRKFEKAGFKYYVDGGVPVLLSSEALLNSYLVYGDAMEDGGESIEGYNSNAKLGDTVMSGLVKAEYNKIDTVPFDNVKLNTGYYEHHYNPQGNNQFQIEVFTKTGRDENIVGDLYYLNLPVDKWYNLALYKYVTNREDFSDSKTHLGITLTDVTAEGIEDVTNKSKEIFNIYTPNDKILYGVNPHSYLSGSDTTVAWISNGMYNYESEKDIEFDPCSRYSYAAKWYTSNPKYLYKTSDNLTDDEYKAGKGKYLIKLSNSIENLDFSNESEAEIKLFANNEISGVLSNFFEDNSDYSRVKGGDLSGILNGYYPNSIIYNGDSESYSVLRKKDKTYHIENVENMRFNSIMWISSPNMSESNKNGSYFDMFNDSLDSVYDYESYFGNPQHRLPPVAYTHRILDSDYATFIYNSCEKTSGYKNITYVGQDSTIADTIVQNYERDPMTIAYVWNNSQVTRNETYKGNETSIASKLHWVKSSNAEYSAEIGSIYNYQNLASIIVNNKVITEVGSINQRQTTLMPVLSTPLSFEKKMNNQVMISINGINDPVIATAALGYNSNGYPLNGLMVYNSNESVSIDKDYTTYLYIAQNETQAECKFGATQEKPVYVDTVQENTAAYSEKFEFLPSPIISERKSSEDYDSILIDYYGGNTDTNQVQDAKFLFEYGSSSDNLVAVITGNLPVFEGTGDYVDSTGHINTQDLSSILSSEVTETIDDILETMSELAYYGTIGVFDTYSIYDYSTDKVEVYNINSNSSDVKYSMFIGNTLAIPAISQDSLNTEVFNVFYDEDKFERTLNSNATKYWETKKCFYFDGGLVPNSTKDVNKIAGVEVTDQSGTEITEQIERAYNLNSKGIEIEPSMGIIWMADKNKPTNYNTFKENVGTDLSDKSGHALFNNYFCCNVTGVKLKIKQEHLAYAPIYIKIYMLKAEQEGITSNVNFKWVNDPSFDIDLRATYSTEYDYSAGVDKEIVHQFVAMPDDLNLTKNVFGIKFVIKQIIPQNNEYNSCIIDDIKVYASNVLNKFGQAMAVEDIYVRKNDANCRNFYEMKVNEYVWQVPNTVAEWQSMSGILSDDAANDKKYIDESAWALISGIVSDLSTRDTSKSIEDQLNQKGENFSLLNTYYVTNGASDKNLMTEVLSDNYLNENENLSITWKYVDYVYVYYTSNAINTRLLLEKYFGSKIYSAVKSKLNENIENLNANSAFKDKYQFSGGVAVQKGEVLDTKTNSTIFDWKSSTENVERWKEIVATTKYDVYQTKTVTSSVTVNTMRTATRSRWKKGTKVVDSTTTKSTSTSTVKTGTKETQSFSSELQSKTFVSKAVIENPRFESVDNWTKSFEPVQIKYRID